MADRKRGTGRPIVRRPAQRSTPFRAALPVAAPEPTAICRFLASEEPDGTLGPPLGAVDPRHRCVAMTEAVAQSPQQQHLVCLTSGHVDCPRYLRGVLFAGAPPVPVRRETVSRPVLGATLVLLGAIAASFGFLVVRGSFDLPIPTPTPGQVAALPTATPRSVPSATVVLPSPSPDPTPSVAPSPSAPPPSVEPSATPAPTPRATPKPTPRPTPRPTSDRFAVLTECPSTPNCWIYMIRSGDNLKSIANWFGVSYNRVIQMNPGLARPIHAGQKLRIPTPTR